MINSVPISAYQREENYTLSEEENVIVIPVSPIEGKEAIPLQDSVSKMTDKE